MIFFFFFFTWLSIDIITKVDSHDLVLEKFLSVIITLSLSSLGRIGEGEGASLLCDHRRFGTQSSSVSKVKYVDENVDL